MSLTVRHDREDYSHQEGLLSDARKDLALALASLHGEAKRAHRAVSSPRGLPDMPAVYAAVNQVKRCEQAVDIATSDLAAARGEDV